MVIFLPVNSLMTTIEKPCGADILIDFDRNNNLIKNPYQGISKNVPDG